MKQTRGKKRFEPYRRTAGNLTWTHKFVCLAEPEQDDLPSAAEKYKLKCNDLGEKKVVLKLNGNWSHIKETVIKAYPALEKAGGFELLRTDGPYSKRLATIGSKFLISVSALKEFVDQARVFVRPIQLNLPLECDKEDDKPEAVHVSRL